MVAVMKNIIFCLSASAGLLLSGCDGKPSWTLLTPFDGGTAYYLPAKSDAKIKDASPGGSVRWTFGTPQQLVLDNKPALSYLHKEATILFNCGDRTYAMPDYSFHNTLDGKSEVVHWVSETPEQMKWRDIQSDSIVAALAQKIAPACAP